MLKLSKLECGLFTEAQMQGVKVLHFAFEDDSEKIERNENGKATEEATVKRCTEILDDLKKELDSKHLEKEWVNFLLGSMYAVFTGDCMASPDNLEISQMLFTMLSHISHDLQNDTEAVEFRKRPPMFVFYGQPVYSTGTQQFYENFNVVFCNVDAKALPSNMFALIEMQSHTFCTIQAECKNADDVQSFYSNYIANDTVKADPNRTVAIVKENKGEILHKCYELGVRCCTPLYDDSRKMLVN